MNILDKAPEKGIMYALYTDRMEFSRYHKAELLKNENKLKENLLEIHLFDREKEYRCVRASRGEIEAEIEDSQADDIYEECIFTSNPDIPRVCVINYLTYDENDLMMINNYRLKEVEE